MQAERDGIAKTFPPPSPPAAAAASSLLSLRSGRPARVPERRQTNWRAPVCLSSPSLALACFKLKLAAAAAAAAASKRNANHLLHPIGSEREREKAKARVQNAKAKRADRLESSRAPALGLREIEFGRADQEFAIKAARKCTKGATVCLPPLCRSSQLANELCLCGCKRVELAQWASCVPGGHLKARNWAVLYSAHCVCFTCAWSAHNAFAVVVQTPVVLFLLSLSKPLPNALAQPNSGARFQMINSTFSLPLLVLLHRWPVAAASATGQKWRA